MGAVLIYTCCQLCIKSSIVCVLSLFRGTADDSLAVCLSRQSKGIAARMVQTGQSEVNVYWHHIGNIGLSFRYFCALSACYFACLTISLVLQAKEQHHCCPPMMIRQPPLPPGTRAGRAPGNSPRRRLATAPGAATPTRGTRSPVRRRRTSRAVRGRESGTATLLPRGRWISARSGRGGAGR